ncbi:IS66 family transposase [Shimia thalassica]|uniref:IS66 family transposase n=1 Tax=Shimia thalassica TaxID=1715693 RepID=UPI001C0A64A3|nr:IS66 family transposase [Shimia thalassica]MBU2941350.1 IS66 family transposase [Shimia thalassica]MDO6503165.1 IS66 family transposase [Shimia thalassica]
MDDTIERLLVDIAALEGPEGSHLAEQVEVLLREMQSETVTLRAKLAKANTAKRIKDARIKELERQVADLKKMVFGANSDRNPDKGQLKMDEKNSGPSTPEGAPEDPSQNRRNNHHGGSTPPKPATPRNRSGRGKREFPKHLERREIYMGTLDRKCPCGCGGSIREYDINETLEVIPARYYVAVRQYPRYRCRVANKVVGTPFIPRVFPQTTMSNGVLASAMTMRFGWQLPWYRQENIHKANGVDLKRSTLLKWSNRVATQALLPIYELLKSELQQNSARLFMDETTVPMLAPGKGKTSTSYLFAIHRDDRSFGGNQPPIVLYCPSRTRAMYKIHELLNGVTAIVQTDAYAGYGKLGREGTGVEGVISPKCWAHTRRHFTDEYEFNKTEDARTVIRMIAELYAEEFKIRGMPPMVREAHRRKYSVPILARLKAFLDECTDRHLSKNRMAKAINYAKKHWPELVLFVDDGRIDLDTNPVERMFKPSILLRKNALFMGSDEGAEAWGILSSIVETCKLNGVNVEPYLNWVLDEIAAKLPRSGYDKLLPWNVPSEFLIGN